MSFLCRTVSLFAYDTVASWRHFPPLLTHLSHPSRQIRTVSLTATPVELPLLTADMPRHMSSVNMLVALAKSFSQPHRPHPPAFSHRVLHILSSFLPSLPQSVNHANKLVMNIMYVWAWAWAGRGEGQGQEQGVLLLRMFGTHSQCEMARPGSRFRLPEGNICPRTRVQPRSGSVCARGGGNPCENKRVSKAD